MGKSGSSKRDKSYQKWKRRHDKKKYKKRRKKEKKSGEAPP